MYTASTLFSKLLFHNQYCLMHYKIYPQKLLFTLATVAILKYYCNILHSCALILHTTSLWLTCVTWAVCSGPAPGFPYEYHEYLSLKPHVWTVSSESICHSESPALLAHHTEGVAADWLAIFLSLHLSHLYLQWENSHSICQYANVRYRAEMIVNIRFVTATTSYTFQTL
jgi:hypothetical protein